MLGIRKSAFGGHFDFVMFVLRFSILRSRFNFELGQPIPADPQYVNRGKIIALYITMAVDISMELRMRLSRLILPAAFLQVMSRRVSSFNEGSEIFVLFCTIDESLAHFDV